MNAITLTLLCIMAWIGLIGIALALARVAKEE